MGKGCEGIIPQGKGLHNSRKLRKVVAIYKTDKLILFKKSLKKVPGSNEARKNYLTQKVVAPNLFFLVNQLHILCLWYDFEQ